jgi:hypothetical protein
MAWTLSGFFTQTIADIFGNTTAMDWGTATWNIALFNDTAVPDFTVTAANSAYGVGVWAANEVDDPAPWPSGGPALVTSAPENEQPAAGQTRLDATDVSETGTTLVAAEGCLIYMGSLTTPVVDQGLMGIDFAAPFSTTNGTFAVTWDTNGVAYFDVW